MIIWTIVFDACLCSICDKNERQIIVVVKSGRFVVQRHFQLDQDLYPL